jgi:uncharacterized protein with HEPN domain
VLPDRDAASLLDMLAAARRVLSFVQDTSRETFLIDPKTQSAVIHQVLILGEACKRLTPAFRDAHGDVPWASLARTRDILIHHYEGVDLDEVWRIAVRDMPPLLTQLQTIAAQLDLPHRG